MKPLDNLWNPLAHPLEDPETLELHRAPMRPVETLLKPLETPGTLLNHSEYTSLKVFEPHGTQMRPTEYPWKALEANRNPLKSPDTSLKPFEDPRNAPETSWNVFGTLSWNASEIL